MFGRVKSAAKQVETDAEAETVAELRARVDELASETGKLRAKLARPTAGQRGRTVAAVLLLVAAMLLAPIAAVASWARAELVDTDRFVATFAPLADHPDVQSFITDEVSHAIVEGVDVDALVAEVFTGIGELGLPPRSSAAIGLLEGPAAEGIRSMIHTGVERVVQSPQFAELWAGVLRQTHTQAVAVLQSDPAAMMQLSDDGILSVQLSVVIERVKQELIDQGMGFAQRIPVIDRSIPVLSSDSLVTARAAYQVSAAVGHWLPWIVLGLLVLGIGVARKRLWALMWTGLGLATSFMLLGAGLGTGKLFFVTEMSPSIMPAATATAMFGQLTELMFSTIAALTVVSLLTALVAWLFGGSRPATAIREWSDARFTAARAGLDRIGMDPRGFGTVIHRMRGAIAAVAILTAVLTIFLIRPVSVGSIVWVLVGLLAVLLLVELIRRPGAKPALNDGATPQES